MSCLSCLSCPSCPSCPSCLSCLLLFSISYLSPDLYNHPFHSGVKLWYASASNQKEEQSLRVNTAPQPQKQVPAKTICQMVLKNMPTHWAATQALWRLFQKLSKVKGSKMSRHPSFGKSTKGAKKRNVLKRFERVDVLKKLGRWDETKNTRVTGLPKTPAL